MSWIEQSDSCNRSYSAFPIILAAFTAKNSLEIMRWVRNRDQEPCVYKRPSQTFISAFMNRI